MKKITLFTITGLPARIIQLVIGGPILLFGSVLAVFSVFGSSTLETVGVLLIGGLIGVVGLLLCKNAVFGTPELKITFGGKSSTHHE